VSFHIIEIGSRGARLTCRDGFLVCTSEGNTRSLPLEDVCSIVITSFDATIASTLLIEAAKAGASLVLCHNFKPVSVMLPTNRSTDTLLTRAQFSLPSRHRAQLWQATIDAKCRNQCQAALNLGAGGKQVEALRRTAMGNKPFKEAACARLFWAIFARAMHDEEFRRRRSMPGANALLNYGYAVIFSVILQRLLAVGIDPTWGIAHVQRERAVALAYDLMEPFRPLVDERVSLWIKQGLPAASQVDAGFKRWMAEVCRQKITHCGASVSVVSAVEAVVRSLRHAITAGRPSLYRPWISTNTKWAGS
jgi:CRISPR-associated protein Cas1